MKFILVFIFASNSAQNWVEVFTVYVSLTFYTYVAFKLAGCYCTTFCTCFSCVMIYKFCLSLTDLLNFRTIIETQRWLLWTGCVEYFLVVHNYILIYFNSCTVYTMCFMTFKRALGCYINSTTCISISNYIFKQNV